MFFIDSVAPFPILCQGPRAGIPPARAVCRSSRPPPGTGRGLAGLCARRNVTAAVPDPARTSSGLGVSAAMKQIRDSRLGHDLRRPAQAGPGRGPGLARESCWICFTTAAEAMSRARVGMAGPQYVRRGPQARGTSFGGRQERQPAAGRRIPGSGALTQDRERIAVFHTIK